MSLALAVANRPRCEVPREAPGVSERRVHGGVRGGQRGQEQVAATAAAPATTAATTAARAATRADTRAAVGRGGTFPRRPGHGSEEDVVGPRAQPPRVRGQAAPVPRVASLQQRKGGREERRTRGSERTRYYHMRSVIADRVIFLWFQVVIPMLSPNKAEWSIARVPL